MRMGEGNWRFNWIHRLFKYSPSRPVLILYNASNTLQLLRINANNSWTPSPASSPRCFFVNIIFLSLASSFAFISSLISSTPTPLLPSRSVTLQIDVLVSLGVKARRLSKSGRNPRTTLSFLPITFSTRISHLSFPAAFHPQ